MKTLLAIVFAAWTGFALAQAPAAGVDTPQDLERVRALFAAGGV